MTLGPRLLRKDPAPLVKIVVPLAVAPAAEMVVALAAAKAVRTTIGLKRKMRNSYRRAHRHHNPRSQVVATLAPGAPAQVMMTL